MRSVIHVERRRTAPGEPVPVDAEAIPARAPRSIADPRRRLGRHSEARRFLAEHGANGAVTPGVWDGLLNALRYHTIQDTLASLAAWERQVLHLAFVEGRTNREIAAILAISRSTVRRRMVLALANLDEQIQRAGTKASAVLLLLFASALAGARAVARPVSAIRDSPAGNLILTTAAGAAAGALVVSAIATTPAPAAGDHATARSLPQVTAGAPLVASAPVASIPATVPANLSQLPHGTASSTTTGPATATQPKILALDSGCDGNPTNAPPATPVGPRGQHPGAPVTHPGPGGCGPHGTEGP